ncbi:MAG: hypothetical protein F6K48_14685 [Okeania sp. SIO3H1]|nr:hypothetical protein [Okeania sp. SIO3H1]
MTKLLEEAIAALTKLPESEQDGIATLILEEIASEKRVQEASDKSQSQLGQQAEEASDEFRQDDAKTVAREKKPSGSAVKPFWQKIKEIGAKVPREEWEKLPKDFARNFESYMYAVPTEE